MGYNPLRRYRGTKVLDISLLVGTAALILALIGEPIEVGSVMAYPRTTGAGRSPQGQWVTLELAEALS